MTHLDALRLRLSHERSRLSSARTARERKQREVWVAQIEREIADERAFLGLPPEVSDEVAQMSDDDLLAELEGNGAPNLGRNARRSAGSSDVAAGKKLARDMMTYAQKTARDMGCSFTEAVRAMSRDPQVVANELGVSGAFVTVWCAGVVAPITSRRELP